MLTYSQLQEYRKLTARYPNNVSAKIINELLNDLQEARNEIFKLRRERLDKKGPLTDDSPMPFGQYKKEKLPLREVPEDYLRWWYGQQDKERLEMDAELADYPKRAVALKLLKLYDYLTWRFRIAEKQRDGTAPTP